MKRRASFVVKLRVDFEVVFLLLVDVCDIRSIGCYSASNIVGYMCLFHQDETPRKSERHSTDDVGN